MTHESRKALSRRELYDRIWKEPMTKVAKEFGLSDRGLAKICERNGIPVPPRGYWAKKAAGRKPTRPPLLDLGGERSVPAIEINSHWQSIRAEQKTEQSDTTTNPYRVLFERELQEIKPIVVSGALRNPHPVIAKWIEEDKRDRAYWNGNGFSHTSIGKRSPLEGRRLRVLDALLKALQARGFVAEQGQYRKDLWVQFGPDKVSLALHEHIRQRKYKLSDEERAQSHSGQVWRQVKEPTGELILKITSFLPSGIAGEWRDAPEAPLDTKLRDAVASFIVAAAYARERRLQQEEQDRLRREAEGEARRREKERQAELARKRVLRAHTRAWHMATELRDYVAAVRRAAEAGDIGAAPEEIEKWASWALAHANEIDPISANRSVSLALSGFEEGALPYESSERPAYAPYAPRWSGFY
jgi:hypothetical protein